MEFSILCVATSPDCESIVWEVLRTKRCWGRKLFMDYICWNDQQNKSILLLLGRYKPLLHRTEHQGIVMLDLYVLEIVQDIL